MKQKQEHHIIDILFVIALFCIFALSAIFLISIGANIYGKIVSHMENNFDGRTAFAYVTEKIRQSDCGGNITIEDLEGEPALVIHQTVNDTVYATYLYEHDGFLKELMVRIDTPLGRSAGQVILSVSDFSLKEIKPDLYFFSITTKDNEHYELLVSTKSTGGNDDEK